MSLAHGGFTAAICILYYLAVLPSDEAFERIPFEGVENPGEDPVAERAGVPRNLLLMPGLMLASILLLLLTSYTAIDVGSVGTFRNHNCVQHQVPFPTGFLNFDVLLLTVLFCGSSPPHLACYLPGFFFHASAQHTASL